MASNLVRAAAKAIRDAARREFARSQVGRLAKEIERAAGKGHLTSGEVSRFARRLSAITGENVAAEFLRNFGMGDVERYARSAGGRRWFGNFLDQLGPVGRLIKSFTRVGKKSGGKVSVARELEAAGSFLRAFGHVVLPPPGTGSATREQQRQMGNLLKSMGWKVEEPPIESSQGPTIGAPGPSASGGPGRASRPRRTVDVDFGDSRLRNRVRKSDPLVSGEMIPVTSSNVHSIGFRIDPADSSDDLLQTTGTLLIRFLATTAGGKRSGPGPLYEYYDVPARVFQAFRRASRKGEFVWDDIRVRGTISGHRYSYSLADIVGGYVPRQAGLKRGEQGEFYLTRRFRDASGRVFTSRLPEERVKLSGPNRGVPNRAGPFRAGPNRGRR